MLRAQWEAIQLGLSQSDLARSCGVKPPTINSIFRERSKPYPKIKAGIASALDWDDDPDLLFEPVCLPNDRR